MNTLLMIIASLFAFNALLFAWMAFGRFVDWPAVFKSGDRRAA